MKSLVANLNLTVSMINADTVRIKINAIHADKTGLKNQEMTTLESFCQFKFSAPQTYNPVPRKDPITV